MDDQPSMSPEAQAAAESAKAQQTRPAAVPAAEVVRRAVAAMQGYQQENVRLQWTLAQREREIIDYQRKLMAAVLLAVAVTIVALLVRR